MTSIPKADWQWFGSAAHLSVARNCQFHLTTLVGNLIVSTVGEYVPDAPVRELLAKHRGITLTGIGDYRLQSWLEQVGFEEIGRDRTYETVVFVADGGSCKCGCGQPTWSGTELAMEGYRDAKSATEGHLRLCNAAACGATHKARALIAKMEEEEETP